MKAVLITSCIALAACGGDGAVSTPSGVAPDGPPKQPQVTKPVVELAEPPEPTPTPTTATTPAEPAPAPKIVFEVDPLGRFEVITWVEAARRAEGRIQADSAQATLRQIRQDILSRRR